MLQRVNEMFQTPQSRAHEPERCYYDSLIIILTSLERCLSNQTKDTARFEEAMNVKLLLREICQFIGTIFCSSNFLLYLILRCFFR